MLNGPPELIGQSVSITATLDVTGVLSRLPGSTTQLTAGAHATIGFWNDDTNLFNEQFRVVPGGPSAQQHHQQGVNTIADGESVAVALAPTYTFDAQVGVPFELAFGLRLVDSANVVMDFSNTATVGFEAPAGLSVSFVPEPATAGLLALGLGSLGLHRRSRSRRSLGLTN